MMYNAIKSKQTEPFLLYHARPIYTQLELTIIDSIYDVFPSSICCGAQTVP